MFNYLLKTKIHFCLLLFFCVTTTAQTQIIINEFSQGDASDHDWIELVVTADGTNIQGVYFTTSSSPNDSAFTTKSVQLSTTLAAFSNVSKGSVIVIYKSPNFTDDGLIDTMLTNAGAPDTDFADGKIMIPHDNATFIEQPSTWPSFIGFNGDNIGLLTSGGSGLHLVSYGGAAATTEATRNLFGDGSWGQAIMLTTVGTSKSGCYTQQTPGQSGNSANWSVRVDSLSSPGIIDGTLDNSTPPVSLIINEISQGDGTDHDWIELVVTADGTNIQGVYFTTSTSPNDSAFTTKSVQLSTTLAAFSNVSKGSVIVIYKSPGSTSDGQIDPMLTSAGAPDTDFADGKILIPHDNATFIEQPSTWPSFKGFNGDNIGLLTSGGSGLHSVSYGGNAATTAATKNLFGPGSWGHAILLTTIGTGKSAYFSEGTDDQAMNSPNWLVQLTSSSTPGTLNGGNNNALPVELVSFSALLKENAVQLNWMTATEVNNYGFNVERKRGIDDWNTMGFVEGHGNTNSAKEYSFLDSDIAAAGKYFYRLKQIDNDGSYEYSQIIQVDFNSPISFELRQNYPNPFNPSTTITFNLPVNEIVSLSVYNMLGEEIQILQNGYLEAGMYTYNFNAVGLSSGFYIYKLSSNNKTQTRKMLLLK